MSADPWSVCRRWRSGSMFLFYFNTAIIVGEPNPLAAAVHDRMPVILDPEDYDRWLAPETPTDELRVRPFPAEGMRAEAISRLVNNVRNDSEACIEPIGEPPL